MYNVSGSCLERFDCDPDSPSAANQLFHLLDKVAHFLDSIESPQLEKLRALANFISLNVYDYIRGCATYQPATDILAKLYVNLNNKIFA